MREIRLIEFYELGIILLEHTMRIKRGGELR